MNALFHVYWFYQTLNMYRHFCILVSNGNFKTYCFHCKHYDSFPADILESQNILKTYEEE